MWSPEIDFKEIENYFTDCSATQIPRYAFMTMKGGGNSGEVLSSVFPWWSLLAWIIPPAFWGPCCWKRCWDWELVLTGSWHYRKRTRVSLVLNTWPVTFNRAFLGARHRTVFATVLFGISCSPHKTNRLVYLESIRSSGYWAPNPEERQEKDTISIRLPSRCSQEALFFFLPED